MIKRLLTIYLPAAVVLTTVTLAAVFLYRDADPELENVEFIKNVEEVKEVVEEEVRSQELGVREDEIESDEFVETQYIASQSDGEAEPNRETIRSAVNQTEPVIVIASGPGVSIRCEVVLAGEQIAHDVMQQAAAECGFSYQIKKHASFGVFVDGIGGVLSDTKAGLYWIYSVNGEKANVGVSSYVITPGDSITWNYEQEY